MKKGVKILCIIIGIIIVLGLIFFTVDYNRAKNNERPIFCIKNPAGMIMDGGTVEFFGLGYKIIDFHTLAGFDDIKVGTWFMDYYDFSEEINQYEKKFAEENETTEEYSNKTFTRTYNILHIAESNDENYLYLTLKMFQNEEIETVKVLRNLADTVETNKNYEFTFQCQTNDIEDNIKSIFENSNILEIKETDKLGLDQIQEPIR